ncbi:MAG TPA: hypothetical protein VN602_01285 [Gemmatimonadaceae bacterium]|nr:hypothetical protein [Gemmatimonadaceae bacterium]
MHSLTSNTRLNVRIAAIAVLAAAFMIAPLCASAQDTTSTDYRVSIDGTPAGTATAVVNLPGNAVVLHQDSTPNLPSKQVVSADQGTIMMTTTDPALVSAIRAWMKADNSGYKDTVQRKTVEIDRIGGGTNSRTRLSGAWPTKVTAATTGNTITIVYQQLAPVP